MLTRRALPWFVLLGSLPAQTLVWPGEDIATIDAEHLRAYVPAAAAESLLETVARADRVYAIMQKDAGFVALDKLRLLVADWRDAHNGYSFVVPFPLVQVELAPAMPESTIFAGGRDTERTLVHEFAHQIANDRSSGFRRELERVFGRVLPNDLLSLLLWYVSTPAHQTMPRFWQEGLAVWAETAYADPASAWAGRGRDALTHMVWRLDAAAGAIPDVSEWRITQHEWPFGGSAYAYGTAYLRFLAGHFGDRASVWQFVARQANAWPFLFDGAPRALAGERHGALIAKARAALLAEQTAALATLHGAPVSATKRLTPAGMLLGAPAWHGRDLVFAGKPADGRARLHTLASSPMSADSFVHLGSSSTPMLALGAVRALPDGGEDTGLCYHEFNWRGIARAHVDGHVFGWRVLQPDAGPLRDGARTVVLVQLRSGGGQDLVLHSLRDGDVDEGRTLPTKNTPWSPALRPGDAHDGELVWVETDAAGSTLVLGSLRDPGARTELWSVRGRILHPAWNGDGTALFCCADHTGVANAYRVTPGANGAATVTPVTNAIGGVIACVPSPDGTSLAVVDHDEHGPFLAILSADPADFAPRVPTIELAWPAPGASGGARSAPAPLPAAAAGTNVALAAEPYSGLGELRPLFWAPSTFAVPEGGLGAFGVFADPLFTNVVQLGAGAGLVEHEPVAFASFDHLGSVIQFGASVGRSERTFGDTVLRGGEELDYTETVTTAEVRAGRGLFALERTFIGYVAAGVDDHDQVDDNERDNVGGTPLKAPFRDTEHWVEAVFGYDDSTFYPTSYAGEDGFSILGTFRHSGLGGELDRNRAFGDASWTWSVCPHLGHQIVLRGQAGWSDGDNVLQGAFSVGGGLSTGLPRGYIDEAVATGRYLAAGSIAFRFPVWRPFAAASTTPFRGRQIVIEVFGDTAQVGDDRWFGDADWFTSVGMEVHANAEFFDGILSPGIGIARQLDGEEDVRVWFSLGFGF
ncbi:MAG: hypothetical protein JNK78_15430 [Planctomycetes bacterium]|nr:hypothetical protein [Planctomycetota bacterium]